MKINDFIDQVIPIDKVKMDVVLFLIGCKYQLEIDESFIILPKNIDLRVQTRAYIKADTPDIFNE